MSVAIAVTIESDKWAARLPGAEALVEDAARAALLAAPPPIDPAELSIVLADNALVQTLNSTYRGKDVPTNVLSFPQEPIVLPGIPAPLGDVFLAFETIASEASAQGKTLNDHVTHLVVHGVLHIVGFDHETDSDAETMEDLERRILGVMGVADPYRLDGTLQ